MILTEPEPKEIPSLRVEGNVVTKTSKAYDVFHTVPGDRRIELIVQIRRELEPGPRIDKSSVGIHEEHRRHTGPGHAAGPLADLPQRIWRLPGRQAHRVLHELSFQVMSS